MNPKEDQSMLQMATQIFQSCPMLTSPWSYACNFSFISKLKMFYHYFCFFLQEENLWHKEREDELHQTMTQLNLLEKHRNAVTKKNLLSTQESMVKRIPLIPVNRNVAFTSKIVKLPSFFLGDI